MPRERILVVDDDIDVLESIHDELAASFDVEAVSSGKEAIERLRQTPYDAVVADLRMPEINGVQVLDAARRCNPETIRIMLTGHLDEDARKATMGFGAPFKIGKPWHDALDVTLRRALEHRERIRNMSASFDSLLDTAGIDDQFASAEGLVEISKILVERARMIREVDGLSVSMIVDGQSHTLSGFGQPSGGSNGSDWRIDQAMTSDGKVRTLASGFGATSHAITVFLVQRAARWSGDNGAPNVIKLALADPVARAQLFGLNRRATLGAMTASITHELASLVQNVQLCVGDLAPTIESGGDADLQDSMAGAIESSQRLVNLYRSLRNYIHSGEANPVQCRVADLVASAVSICRIHTRKRRSIQVEPLPNALVFGDATLLTQVLVNVVRNAGEATPDGSTIDVSVETTAKTVAIQVVDDGPGVAFDIIDHLFEPYVTSKSAGTGCGLGLAISAQILKDHQGTISYAKHAKRGACFVVTLPRTMTSEPE
jgi:signal transduction histidine kinase/DNA-binding response OmpR family regulator